MLIFCPPVWKVFSKDLNLDKELLVPRASLQSRCRFAAHIGNVVFKRGQMNIKRLFRSKIIKRGRYLKKRTQKYPSYTLRDCACSSQMMAFPKEMINEETCALITSQSWKGSKLLTSMKITLRGFPALRCPERGCPPPTSRCSSIRWASCLLLLLVFVTPPLLTVLSSPWNSSVISPIQIFLPHNFLIIAQE